MPNKSEAPPEDELTKKLCCLYGPTVRYYIFYFLCRYDDILLAKFVLENIQLLSKNKVGLQQFGVSFLHTFTYGGIVLLWWNQVRNRSLDNLSATMVFGCFTTWLEMCSLNLFHVW